jgi:hypothetical protein
MKAVEPPPLQCQKNQGVSQDDTLPPYPGVYGDPYHDLTSSGTRYY